MYMDIYRMKCSVESGMNSMHNKEWTSRQAQWHCHTWRAQPHTSRWHSMQIKLCIGTFVDCHHLSSCSPVQWGFQFVSSSLMAARAEGIKEEHGHDLYQDVSLTSWWAIMLQSTRHRSTHEWFGATCVIPWWGIVAAQSTQQLASCGIGISSSS